jgi:mRNA interferase RelE/StbE
LGWTIEISDFAEKQLKKLDRPIQSRILNYLDDRLEGCKNPQHFGEPLKASKSGFWRYRIGDYRVICEIQTSRLVVLALSIRHRRETYK